MRLFNRFGTFDLPDGFALNLERTNPFLTDEGDTSVPVTLPSSPNNLYLLGHIERIDAKNSGMVKDDACLTVGAITVMGTLLVDTLSMDDGIDAVFTFRNGGLYADYKDKSLKDIFGSVSDETYEYQTAREWAAHLNGIYNGDVVPTDYTCFPVMGQEEEAMPDGYTIINQVSNDVLVFIPRVFYDGGTLLYVPEGYGCTPFIYLHRMVELMFEQMKYTVTYDVFAGLTRKLVVLNNTIDAIVSGKLIYADMVPDMTVGDFLTWLRDRFMVQAVIDSNSMTVRIIPFSSMLTPDMDVTDKLIGNVTMRYEEPSHVVLTPTVAEGAEAAAASLKALKDKYIAWVGVDENDWYKIENNQNPTYYDCLILRRSTGMFYEMRRDIATGSPVLKHVGGNYFDYDRENFEQTEAYNPQDVMPLMVCSVKHELYPVIGKPIHKHSTYSGLSGNDEQKLMIVQEYSGINASAFKRGGTTQDNVPVAVLTSTGYLRPLGGDLTPDGLYQQYWEDYNNILLGGKKTASMRVGYDIPTFLTVNMAAAKLFRNQLLLPVKSTAETGQKMRNGDSEFIIARFGSVTDTPITPGSISRLRWSMVGNPIQDEIDDLTPIPGGDPNLCKPWFDEDHNETNVLTGTTLIPYWIKLGSMKVEVEGGNDVFLGPPEAANVTISFGIKVKFSCTFKCRSHDLAQHDVGTVEIDYSKTEDITVTFTSETY